MLYPRRVIYDGKKVKEVAGKYVVQVEEVEVDDAWVLENKPETLLLTADKTTITAGDSLVDVVTISVQLQTPMLTDGHYENISRSGPVSVLVDGEQAPVILDDNGAGEFLVDSIEPGVFEIRGADLVSNILTMEAI